MQLLVERAAAFGLHLSPDQIEALRTYRQELLAWNQRCNLTSVTDPDEMEERLFVESLAICSGLPAHLLDPSTSCKMVDIGTGAGLPGLPLKIAFPHWELSLVEATEKKCAFMRHVIAKLDMKGVDVIWGRAEDLGRNPEYRERYDVAVAMAVAWLPVLAELCLPFVQPGGAFVAAKGQGVSSELDGARCALHELGVDETEIISLDESPWRSPGILVVAHKRRHTPDTYPRRVGVPLKRPLGVKKPPRRTVARDPEARGNEPEE